MRAYITGATGCVGRNLVDVLTERGWDVVVLHRKSSDLSRLKECKVSLQEADLHSLDSLRNSLSGDINAIFHAAANVSHWSARQAEQWKDNVLATRNLVQVALEKKVERFIFTSTGATRFFQETDCNSALKIDIPYVRTKRLSELEVYAGIEKGLDAVILHPIIVVGAYDYNNYSQIFSRLKTSKLKFAFPGRISFCHARDVALAHVRAYEKGRSGERYVLGGTHTTWQEFFQRVADKVCPGSTVVTAPAWLLKGVAHLSNLGSLVTGKEPALTPELIHLVRNEPAITLYDQRKAKADLDYSSRSLDQMVGDCYRWLLKEARLTPEISARPAQPVVQKLGHAER